MMELAPPMRRNALLGSLLLFTGAALGIVIGFEAFKLLVAVAALIVAILLVRKRPVVGIAFSLAVTTTFNFLIGAQAFAFGPVSVHWTDLGLAVAVLSAVFSLSSTSGEGRVAARSRFRLALLVSAAFGAVIVLKAVLAVSDGVGLQVVGNASRETAYYLVVAAFVASLLDGRDMSLVEKAVHVIGITTALVLVVGDLSFSLGQQLSQFFGSTYRDIPGYGGLLSRLYIPGRYVMPLGFGIVLGKLTYKGQYRGRWLDWVFAVVYVLGLLGTFQRGVWLSLVVAAAAAAVIRADRTTVVRLVMAGVLLMTGLVVADAVVGRTPTFPTGVLGLVGDRVQSLGASDANADVRRLEDREVTRQIGGEEILGVPLGVPLGVFDGFKENGLAVYTVHNGYYAVLGTYGWLGLASLLFLLAGSLVVAVRVLKTASGAALPWAYAAAFSLVRIAASAWTQQDLTDVSGIVVLALSIAIAIALVGREDGRWLASPAADAAR